MQLWTPTWTITPPSDSPPTASHFGGVPFGLPTERWPVCAVCDVAMTPLLRLEPGPWLPRIPDDHVVLVFKCEGEDGCDFWEAEEGANACLLVPRADLATNPLPVPPAVADGDTPLLPQVWVGSWEPSDDGLTAEQAEAVDDPSQYWDLPEEVRAPHGFESVRLTKAGGAPYWTGNGPDDDPRRPRRLLFQIDNWITIAASPDALEDYVADYDYAYVGQGSVLSAANFMSDGIAYLFDVTPQAALPTLQLTIKR